MRYINLGPFAGTDGASCDIIVPATDIFPGDHRHLVSFLNADFSSLHALVTEYIEAVTENNAKRGILDEIYNGFADIHPWFSKNPANVSKLLNRMFAAYISKQYFSFEKREGFMLSLYASRGLGPFRSYYWLESDPERYFIKEGESIFSRITRIQLELKKHAIFLIDSSTKAVSDLSPYKKISLYRILGDMPQTGSLADGFGQTPEIGLSFGHIQGMFEKSIELKMDAPDADPVLSRRSVLADTQALLFDPDADTPSLRKVTGLLEDKKKAATDELLSPSSLFSLLSFEIWDMFKNGDTLERDAFGRFSEPDSDVHARAAEGPRELYKRAYKTHYARIRYGIMTKEQLSEWVKSAKEMKRKAENGEISLEEFALFLKK